MQNWKTAAAASIVTHAAPATTNPDVELATELQRLISMEQVAAGSLAFANSVLNSLQKYGSFTPRQADAVRNLIARSQGQPEPNPVEGPDAALGKALEAALPSIALNDRDFAQSLLSGFKRYGSFTDRQRPHVERLVKNAAAHASFVAPKWDHPAEEQIDTPAPKCYPNICGVVNLDKFARFTLGNLQLTLKNDGSVIWIKWDGRIVGSIDSATHALRTTRRYATQYAIDQTVIQLDRAETDPLAAARENGVLTGRCSCCGRALTDPTSISYGIGPLCRSRGFGVSL